MRLFVSAAVKFVCGIVMLGAMLFWPAGTFDFMGAWLFLAILFIPMLGMGLVMLKKAPTLLEKSLDPREKVGAQKAVIGVAAVMFIGVFVLAGLDRRFGWSDVPGWLMYLCAGLQLAAYGVYMEVMRENAYLSRTIEVQEGQKVVDTGLYGIVRHPMYAATVVMFLAMPLVLGSWASFCVMLIYPFVIVVRILNEEKVLEEGLEGYTEYKNKVKYRLIPFVW